MGKIIEFSIHFDPPQPVFFAGRPVCGYVALELKKAMKMKALRIKLTGTEYVCWKERNEEKKGKSTYTASEVIVEQALILLGDSTRTSSNFLHPCGRNTYKFALQLPSDVPSSFESRYGFIRYTLKAKIEIPWKMDQKVKCQIEVNQLIDTNETPYRNGACKVTEKQFQSVFCLFGGGKAELNSTIPRLCYCGGETILIHANAKNRTLNKMGKLRGQLVQYVTYKSPCGKYKTVTSVVAVLKGPRVRRKNEESWNNQPFNIPMDMTPSIMTSKLISVRYKLLLLVGKSYENHHLINEFDIVIGTIPYMGNFKDFVDNFHIQSGYATLEYLPPPYPSLRHHDDSFNASSKLPRDLNDTRVTTIHVTP